jgi:hypothetical protein
VYQFKFPTKELGPHVARACHALSIDDQRAAFEPVLWKGPDARIEQVWFSGVHSNVGGGYPKQGMSLVALDWMLAHAANHGLRLQKADCELFRGHASVDDHLYDSRAGLGLFYRWAPRDIRRFCDKSGIDPRIHISVTERIAHGTDDYAPGNIPRTATVVTTPVDRGDAERASKEYLLHRRADAVETVIRRALHEHDLLEEVRTPVAIGSASYWCFIVAWIFLAIAIVGVLSGGFQQPWSRWAWAIAGAGLAFVSARILAGLADGAMSDAFSQFWQENQKRLRAALKQARKEAEGGSLMGRRRLR